LAKRQWGLKDRFGVFLRFDTAWVENGHWFGEIWNRRKNGEN
jgi:hypothetical protein